MSELTFPIPAELNGEQLCKELNAELVYINGDLLYVVGNLTQEQAAAGIAAHNPIMPPDTTVAKTALLAKIGITADEAKLL